MRTSPPQGPWVLRAISMPGQVTMWVDHTPRGDVVYVLADEMTGLQAVLLEDELRAGRTSGEDSGRARGTWGGDLAGAAGGGPPRPPRKSAGGPSKSRITGPGTNDPMA